MKIKKFLSFLAAAAISASTFAGLTLTGSAADISELTPIPTTVTTISANDYDATTGAQDLTPDGYFISGKSGIIKGNKSYTKDGTKVSGSFFDIKAGDADLGSAKIVAFKPSVPCTITVYGQYDSAKTNQRGFSIVTDNGTYSSTWVDESGNKYNIATGAYNGSGYVYLTSTDSSIDAYVGTIEFTWNTPDIDPTPTPTVEPTAEPTPVAPAATLTKIGSYDEGYDGSASSWKFLVTPNDAEGTLSVKIGETTKTAETVLSSGTGAVTFGLIVKQTNLTAAEITAKIDETDVVID